MDWSFVVEMLIGIASTSAMIVAARTVGLDGDRATYATSLIAIALFYVVFAVEHGDTMVLIVNVAIAGVFVIGALVGYARSIALVGWLLVVHGLFDLTYHLTLPHLVPAPHWWAPLCLGVDLTLGIYLLAGRPTQGARVRAGMSFHGQ